jgi:hypothetical protein
VSVLRQLFGQWILLHEARLPMLGYLLNGQRLCRIRFVFNGYEPSRRGVEQLGRLQSIFA